MSDVISFRLDGNNPREARAMSVLAGRREAGFSARHILTEALLALDQGAEGESSVIAALTDLTARLTEMQSDLDRLQTVGVTVQAREPQREESPELAEAFVMAVRDAARPGVKLEE